MGVQTKAKYGRVVLKLSGEALLGDREFGISPEYTKYLAEEIRKVRDLGVQVAVVIGGGNIIRGATIAEHGIEEATGHYMGMLAMVINALALQSQLESVGVPVRVQSAITIAEVAEPYIRRRAIHQLEKGSVVIFAAGAGNTFFTNDYGAAPPAGGDNGRADPLGEDKGDGGVYADAPGGGGGQKNDEQAALDPLPKRV